MDFQNGFSKWIFKMDFQNGFSKWDWDHVFGGNKNENGFSMAVYGDGGSMHS